MGLIAKVYPPVATSSLCPSLFREAASRGNSRSWRPGHIAAFRTKPGPNSFRTNRLKDSVCSRHRRIFDSPQRRSYFESLRWASSSRHCGRRLEPLLGIESSLQKNSRQRERVFDRTTRRQSSLLQTLSALYFALCKQSYLALV